MNLPQPFLDQMRSLLGNDCEAFLAALALPAPVSVRLNPAKTEPLGELDFQTGQEQVPWCKDGRYLENRPSFTFDPLLHAGCYYVQEASSMFVSRAVREVSALLGEQPIVALDLCAAPGGKSTLLTSCLPDGSLLVANELIRTRANILAENLIKWGRPDVVVTQSDSSSFTSLTGLFDLILADVPCSGEGMFRKDPDSIEEWSPENVRLCANRQRDIIRNVWPALRPGGFLIYSTCTYNLHEDEENVQWICQELGGETFPVPVEEEWGVSGSMAPHSRLSVHRFFPHRTKGEGFFLALIRKEEAQETENRFGENGRKKKTKPGKAPVRVPVPEQVSDWLKHPENLAFKTLAGGQSVAINRHYGAILELLEEKLRLVHAGIAWGEVKGKDWIPGVSLALSEELDLSRVPFTNLDIKDAIAYLRREMLVLPDEAPRGWVLVCFRNHPLGWIKNLGTRANNTYPAEWRIRSENPW